MVVSKPFFGLSATGLSVLAVDPPRTRHATTPVAPFQLA
jgi:hypothetical protein